MKREVDLVQHHSLAISSSDPAQFGYRFTHTRRIIKCMLVADYTAPAAA
jgi:hypothetical protein